MHPEASRAARSNAASAALSAIRPHLALAFAFSAAVNILFLASPLYMMQLYGRVLNSGSIETLVSLSAALLLALIAMAAADAARGRLLNRAARRTERLVLPGATRSALSNGNGGLQAALADTETMRRFLSGTSATTLMDAPFTLLFLAVLFLLHPVLGLVATGGMVLIVATVALARLVEAGRERRIEDGSIALREMSAGLEADRGEIRALGLVAGLAGRAAGEQSGIGRMRLAMGEMSASVGAAARFVRMGAHSAALAAGAVLALDGTLTPAAMLAAAILAGRALGPTETLLSALRQARSARAAYRRLSDRLDGVAAGGHAEDEQPLARAFRGAALEASRLVVSEPDGGRAILRSVSFAAAPGETLVIAGPSGSGKSTLARALVGAEVPRSGDVRLDRMDLPALGAVRVSDHVGWMPQEPVLLPGTVMENACRFGRLSEADVVNAAHHYGIRDLIERMPRGFHTEVGPGGRALPPGGRQAVALLRALSGPRVAVVLDQPTAQMDADGELAVLNAIRRLKSEGITAIVITHKPVLATLADRIMLMRDGQIELLEDRQTVLDAMRQRALRPVETNGENRTRIEARKEEAS